MFEKRLSRLISQGIITDEVLLPIKDEALVAGHYPEGLLLARESPKHKILFCLTEHYGYPFMENDEGI